MNHSPLGDILDVRISYATAKLALCLIPSEEAEDALSDALREAEAWGYWYFQNDRHELPVLFRDEPALQQAWTSGYDLAAESAEMAECPGCHDGTGNPCYIHG